MKNHISALMLVLGSVLALAAETEALVLCETRSHTVKLRDTCRPRETPIGANTLGLALGGGDTMSPEVSVALPPRVAWGRTLNLAPTVSDDVGVSVVELFIDGQLSMTKGDPPFLLTFPFDQPLGARTFKVRALDSAGNAGTTVTNVEIAQADFTRLNTLSMTFDGSEVSRGDPAQFPAPVEVAFSISWLQTGSVASISSIALQSITVAGQPRSTTWSAPSAGLCSFNGSADRLFLTVPDQCSGSHPSPILDSGEPLMFMLIASDLTDPDNDLAIDNASGVGQIWFGNEIIVGGIGTVSAQ